MSTGHGEHGPRVRLLLLATGSVSAAFLPFHLVWLRANHPEVDTTIVLTRAATRFVSPAALAALADAPVHLDEWGSFPDGAAPHVEWSTTSDAAVVYPATLDHLGRLARGAADTPALLALQLTAAPVIVAPALPPGGLTSHAYTTALDLLHDRPSVAVLDPTPGRSTSTGGLDAHAPAPFPAVIAATLAAVAG